MKKNVSKYRIVEKLPANAKTVKQYADSKEVSTSCIYKLWAEQKAATLRKEGRKAVLVNVMSKNLRGKTDLHGKPYQPTKWIFTNL